MVTSVVACGNSVEIPFEESHSEESHSEEETLCEKADQIFTDCGTYRDERPGPFHHTDDACQLMYESEVYQCNLECLASASCEQLNSGCVPGVDGGGCVSQDEALWACIFDCW